MSEEEIKDIKELIERKIFLAEVSGGLTYSDNKFIDLWNYTIDLKEENSQLKRENEALKQTHEYDVNMIDEVKGESVKLYQRIEKAIEYIENNSLYEEEYDYDYEENSYLSGIDDKQAKEELIEILKGDKE